MPGLTRPCGHSHREAREKPRNEVIADRGAGVNAQVERTRAIVPISELVEDVSSTPSAFDSKAFALGVDSARRLPIRSNRRKPSGALELIEAGAGRGLRQRQLERGSGGAALRPQRREKCPAAAG